MSEGIVKGTIWSFIQRFGGMAIGFVSNMVLARLLCPEDFGTMAMIMVFVSFADVLVDGGLGSAIIQKKEVTQNDLSTVFTTNLVFSIFLFILFFFLAPFVESYTGIEKLSVLFRVESILILTRAAYMLPYSVLNRALRFKHLSIIGLLSSTVSVILAIVLAYYGCGVWSLIFRNIMADIIFVVAYIITSRCKLKFGFYKESFKQLFKFGFFVVSSNLIENVYNNIVSFLVGKRYSVRELGYYNQAYSLQQIPIYSMTSVLNQVLFPYFSKLQDNEDMLKNRVKLSIQIVTFFVFPLLVFLMFYAEPVIVILYSDKWLPCVPYFQLFCIGGFFNAMIHINRSLLKSKGYSKTFFNIQLITSVIGIIFIIIGLHISIIATIIASVLATVFIFIINASISGGKIKYNLFQQIADVSINLVFALISITACYLIFKNVVWNILIQLIVEALFFGLLYMTLHFVFKTSVWNTLLEIIRPMIKKQSN